jgi:hypothetical protein
MPVQQPPKAHCLTITIVGAFRDDAPLRPGALPELLDGIERLLRAQLPEFLPASPPALVQVFDVRDDWIKR